MKRRTIITWTVPVLITTAMLITWQATGGDAYTKFTVVERVEVPADPSDPLAGTGMFAPAEPRYETVRRDEFRLGLLPTPQGLFDKHVISVASVVVPLWGLFLGGWWLTKKLSAAACCAPARQESPQSTEA
jgi:hypothetical protein